MKKKILMLVALASMAVTPVFGVTFPTLDDHTLVSSNGGDEIIVKARGESGWVLVQYCQDNLRAGAGNNVIVHPFYDCDGVMKFRLDAYGVRYGQVAFNFKKGNLWLAIPDCRVKTQGKVEEGMSYYTPDIAESGGALFVYTGSGATVQYPIASNKWCDECGGGFKPSSKATVDVVPVGSGGGMTQSIVKSPDSQNIQTKQCAPVSVGIKGNNNKVVTKIHQQKAVTAQKGATVKGNSNTANTTNNTYNYFYGASGKPGFSQSSTTTSPASAPSVKTTKTVESSKTTSTRLVPGAAKK